MGFILGFVPEQNQIRLNEKTDFVAIDCVVLQTADNKMLCVKQLLGMPALKKTQKKTSLPNYLDNFAAFNLPLLQI